MEHNMANITIIIGLLLIALGAGGYYGGGQASMTAMIPAFFGLPIALLGVVALKEKLRKHAMHGAVLLGLLGFVGALMSPIMKLIRRETIELNLATGSQLAMAAICLIFVVLCVRSFIAARKSREAEGV